MSQRAFTVVDTLRQCPSKYILKHTLPVPDIRPILIKIPYYTNVRKLLKRVVIKTVSELQYRIYFFVLSWGTE